MKNNFLVISDVHGSDEWKRIIEPYMHEVETKNITIVFLGDYFDSYEIMNSAIMQNFINIVEFKKKYNDNVILLLGNHDVSYMYNFSLMTGYCNYMAFQYKELLTKYWDLFQLSYTYKDYIFSHAGITNAWMRKVFFDFSTKPKYVELFKVLNVNPRELSIDDIMIYVKEDANLLNIVSKFRGGTNETGSIIWADKFNLIEDYYENYNQVVGHTKSSSIEFVKMDNNTIIFIDTYYNDDNYYVSSILLTI